MCKFCSIVKCFVFVVFSLDLLKADLILNDENIQTIENLSKKEIFRKEDVHECFSLFNLKDDKARYSQTAEEIKQILKRGKTKDLGCEILANLQKILTKFLVYNIQHLNIQPVEADSAESCFQSFNDVLENQAKVLIGNTFCKKKADFFKVFLRDNEAKIVELSKNETLGSNWIKQCFGLFVNECGDNFTNDQVYKNCINVLIGLIAVEKLNDQSDVLLPLQEILKNLLVFYMQQFDELSVKNFCYKFKDLLQGVLGILPENYKSGLKECFYQLLKDSRRMALSTKEEVDCFVHLDKTVYANKASYAFSLKSFKVPKGNLNFLRSASIYLDRFPSSKNGSLNKFIFFSAKKENDCGKNVIIPEIYCFLSLEDKDIDLTAFSICLYNKELFFVDNGKRENICLYPQTEDNKFCLLKDMKLSMLDNIDALRISDSEILNPSFNKLIPEKLFQEEKRKFLELNGTSKEGLSLDLTSYGPTNMFYGLLWKTCLRERNAEVQHVLTNYSLGKSGIGDKFLFIRDSVKREKQEQQLEIRVHVFATDELLFKALQAFVEGQERKFPKPVFLDYNEKKECFELLDVAQYQSQKKAIYGKLNQSYEILKQQTENIANQIQIDGLMDALLKQREAEMEELDMSMVQEVGFLLKNEEGIRNLNLSLEEIREKEGAVVKAIEEMQKDLKAKVEGLKGLRETINSLDRAEGVSIDLEEVFECLRQRHADLEKRYNRLQESSKDVISKSESWERLQAKSRKSWERLQAKSRKNAEDWEAFKKQKAEHEHAWRLYKEEIKQKQDVELKRQQEESERRRQAEEERKRKEEEQRLEREEAECRRIAEEEQRRREEEAKKPKGFTGQQLVNYVVQHGTPKKRMCANQMVRFKRIQPGTTYLSLSQLDPFFHEAFKDLEKGKK